VTRRRDRSEEGASMVEAALILPLLALLLFGLVEFGRAFNAQVTLTHAAREAVREYAINHDPAAAAAAAQAASPTLDSAQLGVATTPCVGGQQTSVTLTYPFNLAIPFLGSQNINMKGVGVMRCEGAAP
jgi:Flp pilus assembly protein TadG